MVEEVFAFVMSGEMIFCLFMNGLYPTDTTITFQLTEQMSMAIMSLVTAGGRMQRNKLTTQPRTDISHIKVLQKLVNNGLNILDLIISTSMKN